MADITFDTSLQLEGLEKGLKTAERRVESLQKRLKQLQDDYDLYTLKAQEAYKAGNTQEAELWGRKALNVENAMIKAENDLAIARQEAADQAEVVAQAQAEAQAYTEEIEAQEREIAEEEAQAAEEAERQAEAFEKIKNAGDGIDRVLGSVKRRIVGLMKRVLFFSLITRALGHIRQKFSQVLAQNDEAAAAVSRLKGAFNTLATPLINAVIPALVSVLNFITKIVTAIIMIISKLTGKSFADLQGDAKKADKKAKGAGGGKGSTFASFDTINQLDANSGGANAANSLADLDAAYNLTELTDEEFQKILKTVGLIGAGMLAWTYRKEIFDALRNTLSAITDYFAMHPGLLEKIVGYAMVLVGAFLLIKNYAKAWTNGIDWDNFAGMLGGILLIVAGLAIAVGPVAAGFAALGAGIALMALAVKDMLENGINWPNLATMITGVALAVGGLYVALGPVAAGWAAIAGGVVMVIMAVKDMLDQGPTLQNTLLLIAGSISIIIGLLMTGHSTLAIVAGAIMAVVAIAATAGGEGENILAHLKEAVDAFKEFFTKIFAGDIEGALESLKNGFKGLGNVCIDIFEGIVKAAIKAVNKVIEAINKVKFGPIPDWVPIIGGKDFSLNIPTIPTEWSLPRLATGAVIPPNRQFAAVLGDQKAGTNIEAPLDTIVDAFRAVQGEQQINIRFTGSLAELARILAPEINVANNRTGRPLGGVTW